MQNNYKKELEIIGENIRVRRKVMKEKISQDSLASTIHIDRNTLSKIENGGYERLTLKQIYDISEVLNCNVEFLTGEIEEPRLDNHFISEKTGLSGKSVRILLQYSDILDKLLSHKDTPALLNRIETDFSREAVNRANKAWADAIFDRAEGKPNTRINLIDASYYMLSTLFTGIVKDITEVY